MLLNFKSQNEHFNINSLILMMLSIMMVKIKSKGTHKALGTVSTRKGVRTQFFGT